MIKDVTPMVKPRSVAIIGASARRMSQGNVVLRNLKEWGYGGEILPVHPQASEIDGYRALNSIAALPAETDLAIVAIPAADVGNILIELQQNSVRSAIVFSNGFSPEQEKSVRDFGATSKLTVHGPNCMGLVNFTDSIPLYPSRPSLRLRPGNVALVAQSGSAAISIMNSTMIGLSKVITMGSEFQVAAADYIGWLATDDETSAIGVVAESIKDPVQFALAAERVHANGKSIVVLKVGRSPVGSAATQAHTGALVSDSDAYDSFFRSSNIATVSDYDELIATLECFASPRRVVSGGIGIVGISGGQTALACDIAEAHEVELADFGEETGKRIKLALPGSSGRNPIDIGATVNVDDRQTPEAISIIMDDPAVGALVALQDTQESLNPATLENYMSVLSIYAEAGKTAAKPFVVISPTSENVDPGVRSMLAANGVPLVRGLHAGLKAVGNLRSGKPGHAADWARKHISTRPFFRDVAPALRQELQNRSGALDPEFSFRILRAYDIPVVKAIVVPDVDEAVARIDEIGFPMVVKVASRQISHRSDAGGVIVGVCDGNALVEAIATIRRNVSAGAPGATIDGFELQEQVVNAVEAMAGFVATPPFGSLMVVGSGGTLVELNADRAVELAPLEQDGAHAMVAKTRLGKVLDGYRNLIPRTDLEKLAALTVNLSRMAMDLEGHLAACDLNPILVTKGAGNVRVVDALLVCA